MRREKERFDELGARVVLVGLGDTEASADFRRRFDVPFPLIADPEKALFGAFELRQATVGSLLSPGLAARGVAALFKGHGIGVPSGDVHQLPKIFIIDAGGHVRFRHHAAHPADHPDAAVLLEALRAGGNR